MTDPIASTANPVSLGAETQRSNASGQTADRIRKAVRAVDKAMAKAGGGAAP
jgi:hypothetical protein